MQFNANRSVRPVIARRFTFWMIRAEWWKRNRIGLVSLVDYDAEEIFFSNNRRINCRLLLLFSRSTEGFFFVRRNQRYWNARVDFFLGNATRLVFSIDMILMWWLVEMCACQWCAWQLTCCAFFVFKYWREHQSEMFISTGISFRENSWTLSDRQNSTVNFTNTIKLGSFSELCENQP